MALQNDTSRIQYNGNNSNVNSYAIPFVFFENAHIKCVVTNSAGVDTELTLGSTFNVSGAGNPNGGSLTTTTAVPSTSKVTIYRDVPATQTTSYQEGGDFPAESHERALDKLTTLVQQNKRIADRAIRVTESDGARNDFVAAANTIIGLNANKQPQAMSVTEVRSLLAIEGNTLSVPAGMKTFADTAGREAAVPDYVGQLATQRDSGDIYIATGALAGQWSLTQSENSFLTNGDRVANVWNKLGTLTETSGEVAIMSWGDSVSTAKVSAINQELQRLYGKRGIAFDACGYQSSGGASVGTDFTRWPFRVFTLNGAGQRHEFTDFVVGGYAPILCDELTVFYVRESGAGNFFVEADTDGSGTYTTLAGFESVSTANATLSGGFTKINITRNAYRFRVGWVSGTVRIVGVRARDRATGGIMNIQLGYSGQALVDMNTAPSAVVAPILAELNPDIEVFEMKDSLTGWQSALQTHHTAISAAVPSMSFLFVGSNPVTPPQNDSTQVASNETLKSFAVSVGAAFWDGYAVYGSGALMQQRGWIPDNVHPSNDANQYAAYKLLDDLGWHLRADRLRVTGKVKTTDSNTADPWVFFNRSGQPKLQIRGQRNFQKALQFADPGGTVNGSLTSLPINHASNPGAMVLGADGSSLVLSGGKCVIGGPYNTNNALVHTLGISTGTFGMNGAIRNIASSNASPTNGDLWHDQTQAAWRVYTGGLAQTVGGVIFTGTSDATIANSTGQGNLVPTGVGATTIPANWFIPGRGIVTEAYGVYSTDSVAPTLNMILRLTTNHASTGGKTMTASITNGAWRFRAVWTCRTAGVSGTMHGFCEFWFDNGSGGVGYALATASAITVDTTASYGIPTPRINWGTASANNSITCNQMFVTSRQ